MPSRLAPPPGASALRRATRWHRSSCAHLTSGSRNRPRAAGRVQDRSAPDVKDREAGFSRLRAGSPLARRAPHARALAHEPAAKRRAARQAREPGAAVDAEAVLEVAQLAAGLAE